MKHPYMPHHKKEEEQDSLQGLSYVDSQVDEVESEKARYITKYCTHLPQEQNHRSKRVEAHCNPVITTPGTGALLRQCWRVARKNNLLVANGYWLCCLWHNQCHCALTKRKSKWLIKKWVIAKKGGRGKERNNPPGIFELTSEHAST